MILLAPAISAVKAEKVAEAVCTSKFIFQMATNGCPRTRLKKSRGAGRGRLSSFNPGVSVGQMI